MMNLEAVDTSSNSAGLADMSGTTDEDDPLYNEVVKFVIEFIFMPSKFINIYALSVANTACYLTVMVLNLMEIQTDFNLKLDFKVILPCVALGIAPFIMQSTESVLSICFNTSLYKYGWYSFKKRYSFIR